MARTNGVGIAICSCGSELHVVCAGGCEKPDFVFAQDHKIKRASRRKADGRIHVKDVPPGMCTWQNGCDQPSAQQTYRGRTTTKCPKHLAMVQKWEAARRSHEL